jgi:hypothetical protein
MDDAGRFRRDLLREAKRVVQALERGP